MTATRPAAAAAIPNAKRILTKDEPLVFTFDPLPAIMDFWWSDIGAPAFSKAHFKALMDAVHGDSILIEQLPQLTSDATAGPFYMCRFVPGGSAPGASEARTDLEWRAAGSMAGKRILAWICTLPSNVLEIRASCLLYPHPRRKYEIEVVASSASLVPAADAGMNGMSRRLVARLIRETSRSQSVLSQLVNHWEAYLGAKILSIATKAVVGLPVSAIEAVPGLPGAYHVTVRCPAGSKRFSQRDRVQLATLPKDVRVDDGETWADVRKTMQSRGIDIATISMVDAGTVDRVHVARADEERGDDAVSLVVDVLDAKSLDLPVLATSFLITDRDMERAVYETSLRWLLRFGCYASVNPLFSSILLEPALCTAPPSNIVIDPSRLLDKNTRGDPQYKLQVEQAFNGSTLVLVRGCAGSGKSTLISDLIKLHADRGEKILLCAQSHVAVDQPLEKLASNAAITVLRLGILEKVTSKGRTFHSSCETSLYQNWVAGLRERLRAIAMEKGEPAFTGAVEALDKYNTEPPGDDLRFFMETYKRLWNVLAMTTYEAGKLTRIKDELDEVPIFDVAILDEASRATPLDFFAVSLYARKLYVVGDPNQLAPVFTDRDSPVLAPFAPLVQFPFFAYLLALAPPSMVIKMLKQHRQHSHPLRASNTFIELKYAGISSPELLASEDVTRDFPFKFTVKQYGKDQAAKPHFYIIDATGTEEVYPPASTAAMLGDGEIEERASLKGSTSPYNAETARVIIKTVLDMVHLLDAHPDVVEGFLGRSGYIVVITFYSEQKRYLQQLWYRRSMDEFKHLDPMKVVQFDTVDHFQGDQQAIVIVDVVVTSGRYSEFFCSYNRFYVGCSRARNLLIMVMAENTKRLIIPVGIDIATPPWLTGDDAAAAGPGTGRTKIERRAAFQELYDFAEELGSFISWKDIDEADTHHRPILKFDPSYRARDAADAEE